MSKQSYSEKLRDPRWQKKRLEVMQRADFKREDCGTGERTLNAHHSAYNAGFEPWEYGGSQLRCLCEDCHLPRQEMEADTAHFFNAIFASLTLQEIFGLRAEVFARWKKRMAIRDGFPSDTEKSLMAAGELLPTGMPPDQQA